MRLCCNLTYNKIRAKRPCRYPVSAMLISPISLPWRTEIITFSQALGQISWEREMKTDAFLKMQRIKIFMRTEHDGRCV